MAVVSLPAISVPLVPSVRRRRPTAVRLGFDVEEESSRRRHWDNFYQRHQNKFFKDRHYLDKDWGQYFSHDNPKIILEAGCGAGNTIFPLANKYPQHYIHACDFSHHAITLVKSHPNFVKDQINVFSCNIAEENLCDHIMPASIDIVTLVGLGGLYKIMVLVIYFYCGLLTILENLDEHLLFCTQVFYIICGFSREDVFSDTKPSTCIKARWLCSFSGLCYWRLCSSNADEQKSSYQ
ncbi:uncharacterized protein LOC143611761 [Bidens hawaiensis]|uniref:uncharacterized protein LOC143611761 n=1 Tax=Bidens hawaiensis TaxID=980011 RepID=UPI00404B9E63